MLTDMAKYMNLAGGSNDSVHAPITNIIWWCWNANSAQAPCVCITSQQHTSTVVESSARHVVFSPLRMVCIACASELTNCTSSKQEPLYASSKPPLIGITMLHGSLFARV